MTGLDGAAAERLLEARLSPRRREHARRVAAEAARLAQRFGAPREKAELAGLLHDYCRELTDAETLAAAARHGIPVGPVEARRPRQILHGPVAAAELLELGLSPDVAAAVRLHTVGAAGMTVLEKCVYLADFIEPGRAFAGLDEVRALAATSLDAAVAAAARLSLLEVIGRGRGVVPAALALYNESHAGQ
ncbi:MAG: putative nicotinate-nucleotide adenylyltransferase [Actinobacteria bacterium ADurb.BinA094]|nr:MAG: putative nicotinate-nucleotide adenylyltransferase [Actinobacteria bacterium ADurb.BinA094]